MAGGFYWPFRRVSMEAELIAKLHAAMRATFGLRQSELPLFKTLRFRREF